jgi:hypothetical protein
VETGDVSVEKMKRGGRERSGRRPRGRRGREIVPQTDSSVKFNTVMEGQTAIRRSHVDEVLLVRDQERVGLAHRRGGGT